MAKILFGKKEAGQLIAGKTLQFQTKEGLTVTVFGQSFDVIVSDKGRDDALALRSEDGDIKIVEEPEGSSNESNQTASNNSGQGEPASSGAGQGGENSNQPAGGSTGNEAPGQGTGTPASPGSEAGGGTGQPNSAGQPAGSQEQGEGSTPPGSTPGRKFTTEQG